MLHSAKKFIAVLLAIWLPLFGGNALAATIAMHSKGGACHAAVMQQSEPHSHQASARHQHAQQEQLSAHYDLSSAHHDENDFSCKDRSICHMACCGYVASSGSVIVAAQQADRIFAPYTDTIRTLTLPLFDPPPLARA